MWSMFCRSTFVVSLGLEVLIEPVLESTSSWKTAPKVENKPWNTPPQSSCGANEWCNLDLLCRGGQGGGGSAPALQPPLPFCSETFSTSLRWDPIMCLRALPNRRDPCRPPHPPPHVLEENGWGTVGESGVGRICYWLIVEEGNKEEILGGRRLKTSTF